MPKGRKPDLLARRPGETHWQWRNRIAERAQAEATRGEGIVTPETLAQGGLVEGIAPKGLNRATTLHRKRRSALAYMRERGSLTDDQFASAQHIAGVAEMIERSVSGSCASMEAKVDCSGSARDQINESLYRVRAEAAYTEWRSKLPLPRRMFVDMVTKDAGLATIARTHNMSWDKAKKQLIEALDAWPEIFAKYAKQISQEDIDRAHERLRA